MHTGARGRGGCVLQLRVDPVLPPCGEERRAVETGDSSRDLSDELVGDPAGVLGALARIEAVDDVPEVVVLAGGDRGAQRLVGVGADEGQAVEDDPQLPARDVVLDAGPAASRATTARSTGTAGRRTRRASPARPASRARRRAARSRRRATRPAEPAPCVRACPAPSWLAPTSAAATAAATTITTATLDRWLSNLVISGTSSLWGCRP